MVFEEIQPEDDDTEEAVEEVLANRRAERERERELERDAYLRELVDTTERALAGEIDVRPDECLSELHWALRDDDRRHAVLAPGNDDLDQRTKLRWHRYKEDRTQYREQREDPTVEEPDPLLIPRRQEHIAYAKIVEALGAMSSYTDKTRFAPVRLACLDQPGARSPVAADERSPIGRARVGKASAIDLEERAVDVDHADCEHVMCIANPRQGKDSTIARICGNLTDEHGYKWISLFDDGRNETPCIAIPNDDPDVQESLERFGQTPKGYRTRVWVPAVNLPDELPANFEPFTLGVDTLTPEIVGQLAGVQPTGDSQRRIKAALDDVQERSGSVDHLINRLEELADETSARVTVTAMKEGEAAEETESFERTYEMGEDELLRECAQALLMLASEGFLRDAGAETNIDMEEVLLDQETVAVLNCNLLPDGDEHLKYLIMAVWLRLISRTRDEAKHTPRVALEIRELKNLAPSKLGDVKYRDAVQALRQTLWVLSSQGGSRRVLMLGSTQKLNDVYKGIRGNMPIKILLQMGGEKISTLENAGYLFTDHEKQQLKTFPTGWGMLLRPSGKEYPINWCGARCGLGLGDIPFTYRYGWAMGFRVQERQASPSGWGPDADVYLDVDGTPQEPTPDRGEWFLLPADLEEYADDPADPTREEFEAAFQERRADGLDQDLRPQPTGASSEQRTLDLVGSDRLRSRDRQETLDAYDVSPALEDWLDKKRETVTNAQTVLETIAAYELSTHREIAENAGVPHGTVATYLSRGILKPCVEKEDGVYCLTPVGTDAKSVEWDALLDDLDQ